MTPAMSNGDIEPPEGFEITGGSGDTIDLDPGDELRGVVLAIQEGQSEHGPWHRLRVKTRDMGTVAYFAKGQAKTAIANGDVEEADEVWIGVDPEESEYTDEAGETHEFHEHLFAVRENGD